MFTYYGWCESEEGQVDFKLPDLFGEFVMVVDAGEVVDEGCAFVGVVACKLSMLWAE